MKKVFFLLFVIVLLGSCTDKKESLFNGENLDGWTIHVEDPDIDPEDFFYVNDGVIETVGVPMGYLRTEKEYSDYHLHVEWRYPEEPTNSGIFLHTNGPDKIWPSYFQAQLKHENAGDFIAQNVGMTATIRDTVYAGKETGNTPIPKEHPTNEKPAGEWNSYDITCRGNTIEIEVNGLLQNTATECSQSEGGIGLQAEGSKIQFRNLWVKPLK